MTVNPAYRVLWVGGQSLSSFRPYAIVDRNGELVRDSAGALHRFRTPELAQEAADRWNLRTANPFRWFLLGLRDAAAAISLSLTVLSSFAFLILAAGQ